ncbi:MAG: hypothetical protein A2Y55_02330 [Actinobacteria bacterium RBG_16_68_12]|nr:MAG: hypothetical protein A2Y55_02330 [Actinobacteria bacterium RBG_16_68_12]
MPGSLGAGLKEVLGDRVVALLGALVVLSHVYLLLGALTVPQSTVDALLYHLPRAALWKQQHAVAYVADSPEEPVNAHPPNAEIETMSSMILSGGDRYVALVQLVAVAFTSVAIFGIARRLGLDIRAAAFGAAVYPTFTLVVLQTPTALNDLVVAALLAAAAFFATGRSRAELALFALAVALALGTKLSTVFSLPVLALFALASQPRRRWPALALAGVSALAAGSYWYVVNLVETGSVDGGLAAAFPQGGEQTVGATLDRIRLLGTDLLELSAAEGQGQLLRPLSWGLAALALALVVALVLATRRRWLVAGAVALGGTFVLVSSPLVSAWVEVVELAYRQVGATIGVGASPSGPRLPAELFESPMHSSYGLAFVLLLFGAGALVAVEVVRGTCPRAALAALAGVPLFLVIFALPFQYDPQRMRFLAFPVALAAATFGVALRVRPLAWTAVGMTAVTLVISLGYFAPRPAGFAFLPGHRGTDRTARWFVQGGENSSKGDQEAFRFLELEIPDDATLALAVVRDTYLYPAWDAGLRRTVLFVGEDGTVPGEAEWLVIGPRKSFDPQPGWRLQLATERGWRILRR